MSYKVAILEDQSLFRAFLEKAFRADGRFEVVHSGASVADSRSFLETGPEIDSFWLDLMLPDGIGLEIARIIKGRDRPPKVIVLTGTNNPAAIKEAMLLGVDGYFSKEEPLDIFQQAVDSMAAGRNFYSPKAMMTLARLDESAGAVSSLSGREREVLKLTAEGFSMKEIADKLDVAESTVKTHRKSLTEKCCARNIADLTRFALKHGLLVD